ncbi:hypothetical protein AB0G02_31645, partial [Actinosynnema sp. NPDC023658]|uniref:hypothetical protein n=1 Tax=Actinosynnema sp. NPDC023658 TaxID=3155465 RepID=UPI0033D84798
MAHVFLDHALLGELKRSGCTPAQTYLVQRVIRGISGTSLLSHHVSAAAPMTAELPRFSTALASSLSHGQPNTTLLGKLCSGATHAVDRAVAQWGTASALRKVRHALGQAATTLGDINNLSPGKRRADAAQRSVLSTAAADITAASPAVRHL